jgi:hypothetical protein
MTSNMDGYSTVEKRAMTPEGDINLSVLHPSVEKISTILHNRVVGKLVDYNVRDYVFKYGIKKLIKALPEFPVYTKHEHYMHEITQRLNTLLLNISISEASDKPESDDITLNNRFKSVLSQNYINYVRWNNLSASQKKIACSYIIFSEIRGNFIDTRVLDAYAEVNVLREGSYDLPFYGDGRLSIEDAAMVIIDDAIEHDPGMKQVDEEYLGRVKTAISSKRVQRRIGGPQFISKILDGITLTKIIKRLRKGVPWSEHVGKPALKNKVKANKVDVSDVLIDLLIHSRMPSHVQEAAKGLAGEKQRFYVKMALLLSCKKSDRAHRIPTDQDKNLQAYILPILKKEFVTRVKLPFLFMEFDKISSNVTIASLCDLKDKEKLRLLQPSLRHLNGIRTVSQKDKKMLLEAVMWCEDETLFSLMYDEACKVLMDNLTRSIISPSLATKILLEGKNAGVTAARIRVLVKHLFITFPKMHKELATSANAVQRIHHDITTSHAPKILALFESWQASLDPGGKTINRLVELLSTQIAGAQGDLVNAFSKVSTIYRCVGRESQLSQEKIKSLGLLDVLLRSDPITEKKLSNWIDKHTPGKGVILDQRKFMAAATKDMPISNVFEYLKKMKQPVRARIPTISGPISRNYGAVSIEILPINYLDGHLGVSVPGVCIGFDSPYHLEHNSTACANLLVRDETGILLWGLLIRDQISEEPLYFLNNLQGSLPSRWAKSKERIKQELLSILAGIGEVRMNQFSFNALSLIDEETPQTAPEEYVYLPRMRLDGGMLNYEHNQDGMPTLHCQINEHKLYRLIPRKKELIEPDVIDEIIEPPEKNTDGIRGCCKVG